MPVVRISSSVSLRSSAMLPPWAGLGRGSICPIYGSEYAQVTTSPHSRSAPSTGTRAKSAARCSRSTSPSARSCRGRRRASARSRRRRRVSPSTARGRSRCSRRESRRTRPWRACSPTTPGARRASSAWSRPTGGRRRTPGRSASRGPGTASATATPSRGTSSPVEAVVTEMERAFLETAGSLAERLVASLEAGQAAGGDSRGQQSAAIVVERVGGVAAVSRGASTASASCGSRTTRSRSRSSGGCSASTSCGMRSAARASSTHRGATARAPLC